MKSTTSNYLIILLSLFIFFSCGKNTSDLEEKDLNCDFNIDLIKIEPVCSFNPKLNTQAIFPVWLLYEGEIIDHNEFEIHWSSDPDFRSGVIGISYDKLPLIVKITEKSTQCVVETTLSKTYWD